jgi:hypothetical protein
VPLIEPASGPNFASFDDEAHYYFNVGQQWGMRRTTVRFEFTFHTTRQTGKHVPLQHEARSPRSTIRISTCASTGR